MSKLYLRNGVYWISVTVFNKRYRRSLKTRNKKTAYSLFKIAEKNILREALDITPKTKKIPFSHLTKIFLESDHTIKDSTLEIYTAKLVHFNKYGLPKNYGHRNMVIRTVNRVLNWGTKHGFQTELVKFQNVPSEKMRRTRVFTNQEMDILLNDLEDDNFQRFIRFMYYTGVRVGEAINFKLSDIDKSKVTGKVGERQIKLNNQALDVLEEQQYDWNYNYSYVKGKWDRNRKRLGLKDAKIHDIRRTFGYNLIKHHGFTLYQVSKLLGHKSIITTQNHYAPILPLDIQEFSL
jgi:integrase